jgi:dTDP-4-dehydrorhamnose 3,5-epimerase-like enzyme
MKDARTVTVDDVRILDLKQVNTVEGGAIVSCEKSDLLPFDPKRVYYLYDVPSGADRGGHAHKQLLQLMVAVSGSFEVVINDGKTEKTIRLDQPNQGLYVQPGLWNDLKGFSCGAICLVLASEEYTESDYIRTKEEFSTWKSE